MLVVFLSIFVADIIFDFNFVAPLNRVEILICKALID